MKRRKTKKSTRHSRKAHSLRRKKRSVPSRAKIQPKSYKHMQDVLIHKREDILRGVKQKEKDITLGEIGDEADVASQTFEREMIFETTNGERIVLDDVEAAIRKIEKGEFGLCESCHKKIPNQRLHAMPWARYCIQCQTKSETPVHI